MENIEIILSIAATALGLLITAVTFIVKFYRAIKAKLAAQGQIKIADVLVTLIEAAEDLTALKTGPQRKEWVMEKTQQFADDNGIDFDMKAVSDKIEELVALTKQVNRREKDVIKPVA